MRGVPIAASLLVLYLVNGFVNGWAASYDVAISISSPSVVPHPLVAWPLSIAGWLFLPCVAGAVAGYIVTDFIAGRRTQSVDELFGDRNDE